MAWPPPGKLLSSDVNLRQMMTTNPQNTASHGPVSFAAQAFHPDLPGGRGPGELRIEGAKVVFTPSEVMGDAAGRPIEIPFDGLEMRLGGASDRLIFFSHPDLDEVSVYTSDHAVLDHPSLAAQPAVAAQVQGVRGKKTRARMITAAILVALVGAIVGLVLLKDPLVGLVTDWVPASAEVKLGEVFFRQIRASTDLVQDPTLDADLDALVEPLLRAIPETGYPFDFHLAHDPTLNAFAIPGGHVVLHSGLILEAESAEEVLGVLAHEIAHVTERHSLRQLVSAAGMYVLVQALLGDVSGLVAVIADGGLRLLTLEFSRDHEREADDVGFDILVQAGIDPRGMVAFFETLRAEQEELLGDSSAAHDKLTFLSTHPATDERIDHLETRLVDAEARNFDPVVFDFEGFKERLRHELGTSANEVPAEGDGSGE